MTWSLQIAKIAGIAVRVHVTFLLLVLWVAGQALAGGEGGIGAVSAAIWILGVFAIVVLHELGHALMARRFGISTKEILLLPIGGVAQLERMPERGLQEVAVAFAGPAVNLVLAAGFWGLALVLGHELPNPELATTAEAAAIPWTWQLAVLNIVLALFNLLPAFPMDGGRVLRGLLASRMPRAKATRIAANVGKAFALGLGLLGLSSNPLLLLIAVFVWFGGESEARHTEMESDFRDTAIGEVAVIDFVALRVEDPIELAVKAIVDGTQANFPVRDGEHWVGVLTKESLVEGLVDAGVGGRVGNFVDAKVAQVDARTLLPEALRAMHAARSNAGVALVMSEGRLVGFFDRTQLGELVLLRKALDLHQRARGGGASPPSLAR